MAQFFQLALAFACFSLVALVDIPQLPSAGRVTISGGPEGGSIRAGGNFLLTCDFNATVPSGDDFGMDYWEVVTGFWFNDKLVGEYKRINYGFGYQTETLVENVNFYPANKFEQSTMESPRAPFSVVVMPIEASAASGYYRCSATIQKRDDPSLNNHPKVRFFSNQIQLN